MAGKLLAKDIFGEQSELLAIMNALPRAGWLPSDPILRVAVQARIWSDRWAGRGEI